MTLLDECACDTHRAFDRVGQPYMMAGRCSVDDDLAFHSRRTGVVIVTRDKHFIPMWKDRPFPLVYVQTVGSMKREKRIRFETAIVAATWAVEHSTVPLMARVRADWRNRFLFVLPRGQSPIPLPAPSVPV